MTRLLVTGVSGMLGANLALFAQTRGFEVLGWTNSHPLLNAPLETRCVDFRDPRILAEAFADAQAEMLINCAAQANVDAAEKQPEAAFRVNAEAAGELAKMAHGAGVPMIQVSTDAVFDGTRGDYRETDEPNPINVYARTKLEGERAVLAAYPQALAARVNFYGWSPTGKRSLAEFFYTHLRAEQTVKGFTDVFFSPLYVGHLAQLLLKMAEGRLEGLYHVFCPQAISKYAFGVSLARLFSLDETLINPTALQETPGGAPRSLNLSMNTDKLQAALNEPLPGELEGLQAFYADWQAGLPDRLVAAIA